MLLCLRLDFDRSGQMLRLPEQVSKTGWTTLAILLLAMLVVSGVAHYYIYICHGERSFDTAVNVQFLQLALHGWEPSGLLGVTAFGDHFDPLFLVCLPLFAIWPGAVSLQIAKSAVYLGMLPAFFLLARSHLGSRGAWTFVGLIALSPMLWTSILADYHTETLAAGLIPWALLAYERRRLVPCLTLSLLVSIGKENLPLVIGGLGIMALVERRSPKWWLSMGLAGAVVFALGVFVVLPYCSPPGGAGHTAAFDHLVQAGGWLQTITDLTLYRWLGFLLLSCGGLCLLAPHKLWPLAPLLLQHGLSIRVEERMVDFHYLAPVLPLLAYASLFGALRLKRRLVSGTFQVGRTLTTVALLLAAINMILLVQSGPYQRFRAMDPQDGVGELMARIPAGAPAWASLSTATRMAARDRLYLLESLSTGTYLAGTRTFDVTAALRPPRPLHGLIDARDRGMGRLPPGLKAADAIGNIVLLLGESEEGMLVRHIEGEPSGEWQQWNGFLLQAGRDGIYRIHITEQARSIPLVQLLLLNDNGQVIDRQIHRLLYGLARKPGLWETRYEPPLTAGEERPSRMVVELAGGQSILLSSWVR